jgi:hypothetical protein
MRALALTLALLAAAAAASQITPQQPTQNSAPTPTQSAAQKPPFWEMARHSVDYLLDPVPQPNQLRLAQLKQTFTDLECKGPRLREQPTPAGPNLLCTLPGTSPATLPPTKHGEPPVPDPKFGTILFLAHYEHEGPGRSAIENWTGAIMLTFLYHALAAAPRHHTFLFAEVDGESGSKTLFDSFTPDQRRVIKGVVALDALGLGPAEFYLSSNDVSEFSDLGWAFLGHQFLQAAADQRFPEPRLAIPGSWLKIDDTREFRYHSIPSILIHSVHFSTRELPSSTRDTPQAIDRDAYFDTFTLLAAYATELDQPWPSIGGNAISGPSRGRRR